MFKLADNTAPSNVHAHFAQETYPLNTYTLAGKFAAEIHRLAVMDKKDRGLGRGLNRLVEQIAQPSLVGQLVINYVFELGHFNPGGQRVEDWYMRVMDLDRSLTDNDCFQWAALSVAHDVLINVVVHRFGKGKEPNSWLLDLVKVRFTQVKEMSNSPFAGTIKTLPVISVLVPQDYSTWSAAKKLVFLQLLDDLADEYSARSLSGSFVVAALQSEDLHEPYNLPKRELYRAVVARKVPLTTVFGFADNVFDKWWQNTLSADGHHPLLEESSVLVASHAATYLA